MASIHSEYHRFLSHLARRQVHDDVHRLAHLVLAYLQPLAEVGAVRRGRSNRLAPLAIAHLAQMPVAYDGGVGALQTGPTLGRLRQLEVGPFRGFMRQEVFDLSHDITLVYGANGTGKSSFCEALEVAMLGSISEAQVKRVDQHVYCNNARLRRHAAPVLSSIDANQVHVVRPDEAEYRFCFIEKNRLDDFARIAARTPGDQRQLIATLFGIDQFSEFVRGFNPSLDQDLMLVGAQATQLAQRRLQLANSEQTIAAYTEKIAGIVALEQAFALRIAPETTYQACVEWLLGRPGQQGRLSFVQAQLDARPPVIHEVTRARLEALLSEANRIMRLWEASSAQLTARAGEVSYAKLYEAVLALADGATTCPACGTGLGNVAQDPFVKARAGLEQLAQLAAIQQQESDYRVQLNETIRSLWDEMRRVVAVATTACPADLRASGLPALPQSAAGNWLGLWVNGDQRPWLSLLGIAEIIEGFDTLAKNAHVQRDALAQERDRLQHYLLEVERLRTMRSAADQDLASARQTVAQFDEANRDLIQAAAAEVPLVLHHQRIKMAYDAFLPEIQTYLAALPGVLLQGLGEQARQLYNSFNRADQPDDLLQALLLPVVENGKIEVE